MEYATSPSIIHKKKYDNYGLYNPNYKIASVLNFFIKIYLLKLSYKISKNNN